MIFFAPPRRAKRNSGLLLGEVEGLYQDKKVNALGLNTNEINISKGICELYIPNVFTTDGNAKNDIFKAEYSDYVIGFQMHIFNRYGELIFKSSEKSKGWDGKVHGKIQPGTYTWAIRYRTATGNLWQEMQGIFILLR